MNSEEKTSTTIHEPTFHNEKFVTVKYPDVKVRLVGEDGSAFAILGRVKKALVRAGYGSDVVNRFRTEATSGDYDHLLRTVIAWVDTSADDEFFECEECGRQVNSEGDLCWECRED